MIDQMKPRAEEDTGKDRFTFIHWLGLFFTLFSLFLMGDIFYRWDAFRLHSTLADYIPNVALALVLWSILAFSISVIIWLPLKASTMICRHFEAKISIEHLIFYFFTVISITALAWISKKAIWPGISMPLLTKALIITFISALSVPVVWKLKDRAGPWLNAAHGRILPLTWLFTFFVILAFMLVSFRMLGNNNVRSNAQKPMSSGAQDREAKRPNIILVTFDTMTARDMSVYDYQRETTPFIKKWADSASVFTRAKAASNYTAATTPSLMTGKRTWTHRKYHHDTSAKPYKSETENIALLMREYGYYNYAFITNTVTTVDALNIAGSIDIAPSVTEFFKPASIEGIIEKTLLRVFGDKFSTYNWLGQDDFIFTLLLRRIPQEVSDTEFPPELAFNRFFDTMADQPGKPFFAWIHLMPPHAPQLPPPPFAGTFNPSAELREQNIQHTFNAEIVKHDSKNLAWSDEVRRKVTLLRDYYDEFILYCDKQFENFIGEIQKREWSENTVIILSSDHGESFEHDYFLHKPTHLYEQVTHIPLIIKEPGQKEGRIINDLTEQVDIPATILNLADIPLPSWMEGRSLIPLIRGNELPARPVISVSLYKNNPQKPITKGILAVWEDDYKLVHYLDTNKSLLFDLKKDPDELTDLFHEEPETGQRLLTLLKSDLKKANERIAANNNK